MSSHHIPRPQLRDILRYRYHHGPNLGSIFVLERWLYGSMYDAGAAGASELDAIVSYVVPSCASPRISNLVSQIRQIYNYPWRGSHAGEMGKPLVFRSDQR